VNEERQPRDETRKQLRVFGVKVTQFEEKSAALLEQARAAQGPDERLGLVVELLELTSDLDLRLRDITAHVQQSRAQVLQELRAIVES
jgi:hypothetical protein